VFGLVSAAGVFLIGCGKRHVLELRYVRPAEYEIPDRIRRVAVLEFGGSTYMDKQWGVRAADELNARLDEANRKWKRYELVDRKHMAAVMTERDFKIATANTDEVVELGRIADVDAMIYGNVSVAHRDESRSRIGVDVLSRRPKSVHYTARYCSAAVGFTMIDVNTAKTLAAVHVTREYDSDKDKKAGAASAARALGFSAKDLPPVEQVLDHLIGQCVEEFLGKISRHEVLVAEPLERGKGKLVGRANTLAAVGDYAEALALYEQAIQEHPDDHGALFNAGVMCEALGQLARAEQYYSKAFAQKDKLEYAQARKRVASEKGSN
jgi:tetratricopeptide (TPR) repeat protein